MFTSINIKCVLSLTLFFDLARWEKCLQFRPPSFSKNKTRKMYRSPLFSPRYFMASCMPPGPGPLFVSSLCSEQFHECKERRSRECRWWQIAALPCDACSRMLRDTWERRYHSTYTQTWASMWIQTLRHCAAHRELIVKQCAQTV